MPRVSLESTAPRHRKVAGLSDAAFRLWVSAICHARDQGTDGDLQPIDLDTIPRCPKAARKREAVVSELVASGLWEVREEGGWQIHQYGKWNDTRSTVEAKRSAARERMASVRSRSPDVRENGSRDVRANTERSSRDVRDVFATDLDLDLDLGLEKGGDPDGGGSRTDLQPPGTSEAPPDAPPGKRSRPRHIARLEASFAPPQYTLHDDWKPNPGHLLRTQSAGIDAAEEAAQFRAWARSKGKVSADWDAEFDVWIGREIKRRREANKRPGAIEPPPLRTLDEAMRELEP